MLEAHEECEWVAVCDPVPLDIRKEGLFICHSIDQLLESDTKFDVAIIATPNGLHEEHALKALRAGKHVLVEKPMALTSYGARKMIDEAERQDKQLFCVMQNRYSPVVIWLKDILSKAILGKVCIVQVNCYWNRDERYYTPGNWHGTQELDGGVLFTQFSHFVDLVLWLFGDISNVSGRFANFAHQHLTEFEDSGLVQFDFLNGGGFGSFNYSTACYNNNIESSITIIGEKGTVKLDGQYMDRIVVCQVKDYDMPVLPYNTTPGHFQVLEDVVRVLKGGSSDSNTVDALKVIKLIEDIYNVRNGAAGL